MANPAPGFDTHPGHTVEIHPFDREVVITIDGKEMGKTNRALVLEEGRYQPVYYVPKNCLPSDMLAKSEHTTYCPFKGDASYYHLIHDGKTHENAVWYYAEPFDEALAIKNYIAIYPNVATVLPG